MTCKQLAYNYIKQAAPRKVPSGEIQRWLAETTTYTPQNVGRRLRELQRSGLINVSYEKNHAYYELKEQPIQTYQIIGHREIKEIKLPI